jgi:hypothetical protein
MTMVLLKGLNYDPSNQQRTTIVSGQQNYTILSIVDTTGFAVGDFVVLEPFTENYEILRISVVGAGQLTFSSAMSKNHSSGFIYRIPFNQMRFYYATTATGSYTLITSSETNMMLDQEFTVYQHTAGSSAYYYKRTFFNSITSAESEIAYSDYFQVFDVPQAVTEDQMRIFLQFDPEDIPATDMREIIRLASVKVSIDNSSLTGDKLFYATQLCARWQVYKALATKSVSKGYITATVEGRNVTKPHAEILKGIEQSKKEYEEFINSFFRQEVTRTDFMNNDDTDAAVRQEYVDIMNGTSNAVAFTNGYRFSYGYRMRR